MSSCTPSMKIFRRKPSINSLYADIDSIRPTMEYDEADNKQITMVIIGAGNRGGACAQYAKEFPQRLKIVGVCEPRQECRSMFEVLHDIDPEYSFSHWKEAAYRSRFADAVLLSTPDHLHRALCVAFAELGYHILCEKPMATTEKECREMVDACRKNDVILAISHTLRYSNGYSAVKKMITEGRIGEIIGIQHVAPVGWWHFAHSFVRGHLNKEGKEIGSLMTKSCHDLDLIIYLLGDVRCKKIQSFGSLAHFNILNKPAGAGNRCLDCKIQKTCPYSAVIQYIKPVEQGNLNWTSYMVCDEPDIENITDALESGPYGRCVYVSDNDVCDHQTVSMEFEGKKFVTFTMSAFTKDVCKRKIQIFGSKGQIECNGEDMKLFDFLNEKETIIKGDSPKEISFMSGHGYSDYYLMKGFVAAVATNDRKYVRSSPEDSLRGHRLVFAAETSRKLGGVMLDVNI